MKKTAGVLFAILITGFMNSVSAQVEVSIPDLVIKSSETQVEIPIEVEGLSPDAIDGYTFKIGFDSNVISIDGASKESTLSVDGNLTTNFEPENQANISWASSGSITQDGLLVYLIAQVNGVGSSVIEFIDAEINEGDPPFTLKNGSIKVVSASEAPNLLSPENSATDVSLEPDIRWTESPIYNSSEVQVSTSSNFADSFIANEVIDFDTTLNLNATEYGLDFNTTYYWRVRYSTEDESEKSNWSSAFSFTTRNVDPPAAVTLSGPDNGTTGASTSPTLSWNAADGANSYMIQVSTVQNFSSFVVNESTSETSYNIENLDNGTQYYWRVRAVNNGGNGDWSAVRNFTTIIALPATPSLSGPANNAEGVSISPTLNWGEAARASEYTVQVSSDENFSNMVVNSSTSETEFSLEELTYSTTYYWRVRASNDGGESDWSAVRNFTTVIEPPTTPSLSGPEDDVTGLSRSVTISWASATRASGYNIQVSTNRDFSSTVVDTSITGTELALEGLSYLTTYFWRVKATNDGGEGDWSSIFSFTTIIEAPEVSELLFPANEAEEVDTLVNFEWNESERADTYQLQVSLNNDFSSTITDESTADTAYSLGGLEFLTTYYWRVRSVNNGGESDWSSTFQFTTGVEQAGVPSLISPENNTTGTDTSLSFSWAEAENAVSYHIQVSTAASFNSIIRENTAVSSTSITFDGFAHNTRYYWRVRTNTENNTSNWSSTFNFTTAQKENTAPVVENPLGEITLSEDFGEETINSLSDIFTDDFTEDLTIEIEGFSSNLFSAEIDEDALVINSIENVFGSGSVILSATDEDGLSTKDTLFVEVTSVNDLPEFTQLPDTIRFVSGRQYTFPFSDIVVDVEDELPDLSFSFNIEPDELTFQVSISAYEVTISAPDFVGEGLLTFSVEDSDGGEIEGSIVLVVESATSSEIENELPTEFSLSQNYPNPFNPTTQIQYQIPDASNVSFRVFDTTGRMVYEHLNQRKPAGTHTISFDASALSSGLYIYQIRAGNQVETKIMTLIK